MGRGESVKRRVHYRARSGISLLYMYVAHRAGIVDGALVVCLVQAVGNKSPTSGQDANNHTRTKVARWPLASRCGGWTSGSCPKGGREG